MDVFSDTDLPPIQEERGFHINPTTIYEIKTERPWTVGKSLLTFMSDCEYLQATSIFVELQKPIPSKVDKTKYNFKFLAFVGSSWCLFKVKVFRQTKYDEYIIEFQRRSGDSVAFNNLYQRSGKHFLEQGFTMTTTPQKIAVPPTIPVLGKGEVAWFEETAVTFGPIFDLALSNETRYQAEGATAIAQMSETAANDARIKLPWSKRLASVLNELLANSNTIVAFPTSRALYHLSKMHEEAQVLAIQNIDSLQQSTSALVRSQAIKINALIQAPS